VTLTFVVAPLLPRVAMGQRLRDCSEAGEARERRVERCDISDETPLLEHDKSCIVVVQRSARLLDEFEDLRKQRL